MTIKECIDIVDNLKPNQYSPEVKVMWLSFIDEIIINEVLKTHEGYDGRYDDFTGYSKDKLSVPLIVSSPYDRLYTAYLKMKIDAENGETARYNNSASLFNSYMMEYRKFYNKTHVPLSETGKRLPIPVNKNNCGLSEAELENLKRELYAKLSDDYMKTVSDDKLYDIVTNYVNNNTWLFSGLKTSKGTVVSQNADFAEVAEWADGNPNNEDRTGYFVCANVPLDGIVMKKATSTDDVKGVSILAPAFAGNYTNDKVDSRGNLLPKYSYVAIMGFVPVIDNGTCSVGGRCMPDDNGCAIPSSNSMGYQVVNRIDEKRVLIIIEPNGDMVQRVKTKINELQKAIDDIQVGGGGSITVDQTYNPDSENAQSGKAVAEAIASIPSGGGTADQNGLQVWKPNTKYDVGNEVLFLNTADLNSAYFYYAKCIKAHTSSNETNYTPSSEYWQYKYVYVPYARFAYQDMNGKDIASTYATKEEVGNIETALDTIIADQEAIIAIQNALIGGGNV